MKIEKEYDNIFRFALYHLGCKEDAEDVTQETFLRYIEHTEYHRIGNERRILYTIARNLCTDFHRRSGTVPLTEENLPANSGNMVDDVAIRLAMSALPEEDREIVILRYVNDETVSSIAAVYGISRFKMGRRIREITERLKRELGKEGVK